VTELNKQEIEFKPLSYCDQIGRLFTYQGNIYRGITAPWYNHVRDIFESGLIDQLIGRNLFPKTKITKYEFENYRLIIEHERINYITYAHEWTFEMLKAAALTTLEVNKLCNNYGYELKDAHTDNIVFDGSMPKFVDFGSIVKQRTNNYWIAAERFTQSFLYPLMIWKKCGEFIARRLLLGNEYIPHATFALLMHPLLRYCDPKLLTRVLLLWNQYKKTLSMDKEELDRKLSLLPHFLKVIFRVFYKYKLLPFTQLKLEKLTNMVSKTKRNRPYSLWANYHTKLFTEIGEINSYPRFNEVIGILKTFNCRTVTELGANQGELSRMIIKNTNVSSIICLDIDEGALDIAFYKSYRDRLPITHVCVDIMAPMTTYPKEYPHCRFTSEVVIALALTHHLTLGQGYEITRVIDRIRSYTNKYALIEFMPFGLDISFTGVGVPYWYKESWFREAFEKKFRILGRKQLETNRILYIGEVIE